MANPVRDLGAPVLELLPHEPTWRDSPVLSQLARYARDCAIAAAASDGAALGPDDLEHLAPTDPVHLTRRAALIATWYRFHELDLSRLPPSTPPDTQPTFLLLHERRIRELDRRDYRMLDFIARGAMLRDVEYVLGGFGYEPRLVLTAWAASRLLVAG